MSHFCKMLLPLHLMPFSRFNYINYALLQARGKRQTIFNPVFRERRSVSAAECSWLFFVYFESISSICGFHRTDEDTTDSLLLWTRREANFHPSEWIKSRSDGVVVKLERPHRSPWNEIIDNQVDWLNWKDSVNYWWDVCWSFLLSDWKCGSKNVKWLNVKEREFTK